MKPRHFLGTAFVIALYIAFRLLNPHTTHAPVRTNAPESAQPGAREARGSRDVAVPTACTPDVNQQLASLVAQQPNGPIDNVMVCGVTISPSRTQRGRQHGDHQILPLLVTLPGAGSKLVEVVTNDDLDGIVTAPKGAQVFAFGQAFFDQGSRFVAGIHDVHCATHRSADNGWVVVDGVKSPASCPAYGR